MSFDGSSPDTKQTAYDTQVDDTSPFKTQTSFKIIAPMEDDFDTLTIQLKYDICD